VCVVDVGGVHEWTSSKEKPRKPGRLPGGA
jgi:hypothetical protein